MNITKKQSVREGSLKWFARQSWTITRDSINEHNPDCIIYESGNGNQIVLRRSVYRWYVDNHLTNCNVGNVLAYRLEEIADSEADNLTNDDNIDLQITVASRD